MTDRWAVPGMAALAAIVLGGSACSGSAEANGASAAEAGNAPTRVVNVQTMTLVPTEFVDVVTVTGAVSADRDVTVASEESGVVRAVHVERGSRVRVGQPIAKLDDAVLRAQFEQAKAEAALAEETWQRQQRLWERDSIGTEIAYLRARYGAETAAASARALEARLERTTVRAPIDGSIEERLVEVGSALMPGSPVARIVDADPVKVTAGIPERFSGEFSKGGAARLAFDHMPDREFQGRLQFVGSAVDEQNRTFAIEIALPNPDGMLKPGMIARIQVPRRTYAAALVVPRDAVLRSAGGYMAYVVRDEGGRSHAEARMVTTGPGAGGMVVIESGLQAGDRVVIVGQQQLADGDVVRVAQREGGQ
jgi:membrane fusion protein, multidrug efflux system